VIDWGYVLRRAWEITRGRKVLWLFGFLIGLGTVSARFVPSGSRWERIARELPPDVQRVVSDFLSTPYFAIMIVLLVLSGLVLGVGLALLGALGRAALVDQVQATEDRGVVSLQAGWQAGRRHMWSIFLIRLLLGLPLAVLTMVGALPALGTALLIAGQEQPGVVIPGILGIELALFACLLPAVCLAILLSIPCSLLQELAVRACVLEGSDVGGSITLAWAMLRKYVGPLMIVWLIVLGVGVGKVIVIILPLVLVMMVLTMGALLTVLVSPLLFTALALLIGLLAWLVGAAVNSVVETFTSAIWTLAYRELMGLGLTGEEEAPTV
jgi:hypothetical protein